MTDLRRVNAIRKRQKKSADRERILLLLGNVCVKCGFSDPRALQIDHVRGRGRQERTAFGGSYYAKVLRLVEQGSQDYQVLCANCNAIKKVEQGEQNPRKHHGDAPVRKLQPCGTHAAYHRGCRCAPCVSAHREYSKLGMRKSYRRDRETDILPGS